MEDRDLLSGGIGFAAGFTFGRLLPRSQQGAFSIKPAVGSYELQANSHPERYFILAQASLESAIILCASVLESKIENTWSHAAVILSQHFHAFELFYKGAICKATGDSINSHHMGDLANEYSRLYPGSKYEMPKTFVIVDLANDKEELDKRYKEMDQRFRYHLDRNGDPWCGVQAFKASESLLELAESQKTFEKVIPLVLDSD
jgi:hypothetical protein